MEAVEDVAHPLTPHPLELKQEDQVVDQIIVVQEVPVTLRQQLQLKELLEELLHQGQQLMEHPGVEELWW